MKIVYFATGAPVEVAKEVEALKRRVGDALLRVVVSSEALRELQELAGLRRDRILAYGGAGSAVLLWLRLFGFLGLASPGSGGQVEIICFSGRESYRFLKFLALTLRGRVIFSSENGNRVACSVADLLAFRWIRFRQCIAARGPICAFGSARPDFLGAMVASLRRRYPDRRIHGVLPALPEPSAAVLFDSFVVLESAGSPAYWRLLRQCFGRGRFLRVVIPWTQENCARLRFLAWLLPVSRVEIYNEHLDVFGGRNLRLVTRHWRWRRSQKQERRRRKLDVGVVGSASTLSLETIVAALRGRYPGATLHGLLPASLEKSASGLFDSVTVLRPGLFGKWGAAWRIFGMRRRFQCWILPCTGEPFGGMKLLAFVLPLARRQIYNEVADGFPARKVWLLWGHWLWRSRNYRQERRHSRQERRHSRQQRRARLPVGVIGSASAFYLKKIVPAVRLCFPDAPLHALLPAPLEKPATGLFDSVTVLPPGWFGKLRGAWKMVRAPWAFQAWIIPCTDEPYNGMKLAAFLLPLRRRRIYNEQADGFAARDLRSFYAHLAWRSRDRLSFQVVSSAAGNGIGLRMVHLALYPLRLLAGAPLLWRARFRSFCSRGAAPFLVPQAEPVKRLVLGSPAERRLAVPLQSKHNGHASGAANASGESALFASQEKGS